ncbi:phospholipase/carboxylesterase [Flavobacterium sp. 28YEA47A]|uniref:alpha/beta hydrolase n=1 Tax=Flavobacterium sp. 28YEA47A TaxID=3156276 RepID=UPI0035196FD8
MDFQPLHYIYIPSQTQNARTLLLLHGTGGDERDLLPIAQNLGKDYNILSIRGNVLENGMPRFFKRLGMGIFDEKDLEFRTREMIAFLRETSKKENFDVSKIIALGYSNGANIAGATLFMEPDFLDGAILFRPMQPFKNKLPLPNQKSTPILLTSGKNDPTVDPKATENYINLLKEAGFETAPFELNTSHNLTQQDIQIAAEWLDKHFV